MVCTGVVLRERREGGRLVLTRWSSQIVLVRPWLWILSSLSWLDICTCWWEKGKRVGRRVVFKLFGTLFGVVVTFVGAVDGGKFFGSAWGDPTFIVAGQSVVACLINLNFLDRLLYRTENVVSVLGQLSVSSSQHQIFPTVTLLGSFFLLSSIQ